MNGIRGEVRVQLAGAPRRLCLTLGALAEIETALSLSGPDGLVERVRHLSARDLLLLLEALLRGGGEISFAEGLSHADVSTGEAVEAVASAFRAAAG
ncbi:GTA-gp10 family protein [Brevundimonas sp. FT23042]|uniref:GTA-gp10 family protein n=1 Tax=Brevundimonas sp. FT23042 TaxID=3393749 RepID=UPI003B587DCB